MHYPSATQPNWCGGRRRVRRAWPQCPRVTAGYCHSPPTCTRTTQEHNTTRPTTTAPGPFGTKLSPHTCPRRVCGTKLSLYTPSHRMCGTKLSLLTRNGSIWRFFRMQGEFCTALVSTTPSRENFVPNARQRSSEPTQQHSRHHRCEGAGGSGGIGGTTGPGRGAGGGGGARPQHPESDGDNHPRKSRMQFPHDTNQRALKNRGISTIRLQYLKYTQGNCMRNWRESGPWGHTQHPDAVAHDIYGMEERPVGPHAASHRRACPPSARSAAAQRPGRATTSDILQERLTVRAVPDGDGLGDGPQRVGDHGLEAAVGHELLDFG